MLVAARGVVPVVEMLAAWTPRGDDYEGRVQQGELRRLALVHVEGRGLDTERNNADVAAMREDAIEDRGMATPGKAADGLLTATQDEVRTAFVEVGYGLLAW